MEKYNSYVIEISKEIDIKLPGHLFDTVFCRKIVLTNEQVSDIIDIINKPCDYVEQINDIKMNAESGEQG